MLPDIRKPGPPKKIFPRLWRTVAFALILALALSGCAPESAGSRSKPSTEPYVWSTEANEKFDEFLKTDEPAAATAVIDTVEYTDGTIYVGEVVGGQPNGHGTMKFPADDSSERDYMECDWTDGKANGGGYMVWKNGDSLESTWVNGIVNGPGCYDFASGACLIGMWEDGEMEGDFTRILTDGTRYKEVYRRGKMISQELAESGSPSPSGSGTSSGGSGTVDGVILPSAQSFSGNKMIAHDEDTTQPWYVAHINEAFVEEYAALVQNYGFTLRDSENLSTGSMRYVFDYTGQGTVSTFNAPQGRFDRNNVALYISAIMAPNGNMELHIRFGSGVTYMETNDRTTERVSAPEQSSGGGSSSGGDQDCWHCGGSGRCPTCGGSGKVMNWLPGTREYVEQECTDCYRSGVCRDCNGSGRR